MGRQRRFLGYRQQQVHEHDADLCVTKVRKGYPGRRGSIKVTYDYRQSRFVETHTQRSA